MYPRTKIQKAKAIQQKGIQNKQSIIKHKDTPPDSKPAAPFKSSRSSSHQADVQCLDKGQVHTGRHRYLVRLALVRLHGAEDLALDFGNYSVRAFIHDFAAGGEEVAFRLEDGGLACGGVGDGCCGFGGEGWEGEGVLVLTRMK